MQNIFFVVDKNENLQLLKTLKNKGKIKRF